jgi:hypothetical protein
MKNSLTHIKSKRNTESFVHICEICDFASARRGLWEKPGDEAQPMWWEINHCNLISYVNIDLNTY